MNKLKWVMLVDDESADNFFHHMVIKEAEICEQILVTDSAEQALEMLDNDAADSTVWPEIIFLDINMPGMDAWEFLDCYEPLVMQKDHSAYIILLTSSPHPKDIQRARQYTRVKAYHNKPLTAEMLEEIMQQYQNETNSVLND